MRIAYCFITTVFYYLLYPYLYLRILKKKECNNVAVSIACKHTCCSHRGIKHGSIMTTNKFSGLFMEKDNLIREEFLHAIQINGTRF